MSDELRTKLEGDIGSVLWSDLRAHAARGGLFILATGLSLLDVAYAVARDDRTLVEKWLASQQLERPTEAQLQSWDEELDKPFQAVVVQPFALAQEQKGSGLVE